MAVYDRSADYGVVRDRRYIRAKQDQGSGTLRLVLCGIYDDADWLYYRTGLDHLMEKGCMQL